MLKNKITSDSIEPRDLWAGQYKTRTADYGLRTGCKTRTRYKTRTTHYGLGENTDSGIKHGPSITDSV